MRWLWIDNIIAFCRGRSASAIKNISLAEEYLHDPFTGVPVMPPSLIIEGVAQTAGILVGHMEDFKKNVVLAKIRSAEFTSIAVGGDQLRYDVQIESGDERAVLTNGQIFKNGVAMGQATLMFSLLGEEGTAMGLPGHNFVFDGRFMDILAKMIPNA